MFRGRAGLRSARLGVLRPRFEGFRRSFYWSYVYPSSFRNQFLANLPSETVSNISPPVSQSALTDKCAMSRPASQAGDATLRDMAFVGKLPATRVLPAMIFVVAGFHCAFLGYGTSSAATHVPRVDASGNLGNCGEERGHSSQLALGHRALRLPRMFFDLRWQQAVEQTQFLVFLLRSRSPRWVPVERSPSRPCSRLVRRQDCSYVSATFIPYLIDSPYNLTWLPVPSALSIICRTNIHSGGRLRTSFHNRSDSRQPIRHCALAARCQTPQDSATRNLNTYFSSSIGRVIKNFLAAVCTFVALHAHSDIFNANC